MEQGIIDNVVDPKAIKQVEDLTVKLNAALAVMEKIATTSKGGKASNTNQETKAMSELATAQQKVIALESQLEQAKIKATKVTQAKVRMTIEDKVALDSLNNTVKLNAIATSQFVSATERLIAAQKLAAIAAQEAGLKYGIQSKEFMAASTHSNKLAKELTTLTQASGNMGRAGMNNAYNSTFQLTQVMRELPNFAIDARIGFMSLSNNLPMLADGFKQLSNSVDAAGKKLGNAGALKVMLKSLLSLNTVMIIAVTLMTLYGDKVVDMFKKMFTGEKAAGSLAKRMEVLNGVMKDKSVSSKISDLYELGIILNKAKEGTYDHTAALEKYNEVMGNTYGNVKTVDEALLIYTSHTNDYINAEIAKAAASKVLGDTVDASLKKNMLLRQIQGIDGYKDIAPIFNNIVKGAGKSKEGIEALGTALDFMIKEQATGREGTGLKPFDPKEFEKMGPVVNKYITELYKIKALNGGMNFIQFIKDIQEQDQALLNARITAKSFLDEVSKALTKAKPLKETVVQTAKEISVARDYYDQKRGQIVEELSKIELKANKTTEDGVLNSYEDRAKAVSEYYLITKTLAESDLSVAESTANQKAAIDKSKIDSEQARNLALYNGKKITLDEFNKSESDYADASENINQNLIAHLEEAKDKYNKAIYDGERKLSADLYKVRVDSYADEVKLLDVSLQAQDKLIEQYKRKQKVEIETKSTVDILAELFGYQKDNSLKIIQIEHEADTESLQNKLGTINLKLIAVKKGSEDEKQLLLDKAQAEKKITDESADYEIKTAEAVAAKKASLQEETKKTLKDAANALWESYWKIQENNLDKEEKKNSDFYKSELDSNQELYDNKLISQETYEGNKKDLEAEQVKAEDDIEKKRKENEKTKFLTEQAVALGKVIFSTAVGVMEYASNPLTAALVPWLIALGTAQSAAIIAQSIPYFEHGGITDKDGNIIVNERRRELVVEPSGKAYIPQTDGATMLNVPKGTQIYPDASIMNNEAINRAIMVSTGNNVDFTDLRKDLHVLTNEVKKLKSEPSKSLSLMEQIKIAERLKLN